MPCITQALRNKKNSANKLINKNNEIVNEDK